MSASLQCSVDRASPSARHKGSKCRPACGATHGDRLLESIFLDRRVIQTRSQRQIGCRQTSSSGNRGMSVDRGNADDDYS